MYCLVLVIFVVDYHKQLRKNGPSSISDCRSCDGNGWNVACSPYDFIS